jgi:hypothetical protein
VAGNIVVEGWCSELQVSKIDWLKQVGDFWGFWFGGWGVEEIVILRNWLVEISRIVVKKW